MPKINITYPKIQVLTDAGALAVGYKIYTYEPGTSTPITTYSEHTLTTPNANPVVLDSRGEANIFVAQQIKLVIKTDADITVWTQDYVGDEPTTSLSVGSVVSTSGNVATITGSSTVTALTNNLMLVYIPDADNVDTLGATAYSVTAYNDCQFSGPYTGSTPSIFRVEIDGAASSPDTFKWRKDSESYTTGVSITGNDQTLKEGIEVNFAVLEGHTDGDYWTQAVSPPYKVNLDGLGETIVRKNSGGSVIPLEGGDILTGYPVCLVYSSVQSCWLLLNTADYTSSAEEATDRTRYEKTTGYTLTASDHGNEISFVSASDLTLTLPEAATLADKFFYITAASTGTVTIDAAAAEVIYDPRNLAANTYTIYPYCSVQISTNGIDWHIMTETPPVIHSQEFTDTGEYSDPSAGAYATVVVVHGGGGGGGGAGVGVGAGGGGGGGTAMKAILITDMTLPETVTVGDAGTGGAATGTNGVAGGTSSFGAHCSAAGGGAGQGSTVGGGASSGGAGADGDCNFTGQGGLATGDGGHGGASYGIEGGATEQVRGAVGNNYGGGGCGGNDSQAGGAGAKGYCVVYEFPYVYRHLATITAQLMRTYTQ